MVVLKMKMQVLRWWYLFCFHKKRMVLIFWTSVSGFMMNNYRTDAFWFTFVNNLSLFFLEAFLCYGPWATPLLGTLQHTWIPNVAAQVPRQHLSTTYCSGWCLNISHITYNSITSSHIILIYLIHMFVLYSCNHVLLVN